MRTTFNLPVPFDASSWQHAFHLAVALESQFGAGAQPESISSDGRTLTVVIGEDPNPQPNAVRVSIAPGTTAAKIPEIAHHLGQQGLTLTTWDPHSGPVASTPLPVAVALRNRIAHALKCAPADVLLSLHFAVDAGADGQRHGRIDQVVLHRLPSLGVDPERRRAALKSLLSVVPSATESWEVRESSHGTSTLSWRPRRELPGLASMSALLPATRTPDSWATLPLGLGDVGNLVSLDLKLGPHSLLVGPTGSGKTIALMQLASSALCAGHEIVLCDAMKSGADFHHLLPFFSAVATDVSEVAEALRQAYEEGQRRKGILLANGVGNWSELPRAIRERENIHPLTIVVDEFGSLVLPEVVPTILPKDDPEREEAEARNLAKARILSLTGKVARELRFVGVLLQIALQRPDASIISGELRSNLTSAIQLKAPGKQISLDALRMVFASDAQAAFDAFDQLDDGRSRGLAVTAADGGDLAAFRVGYCPPAEIPQLLTERGVQPVERQWDLAPQQTPPAAIHPRTASAPTVEKLGKIAFSLDDLESVDSGAPDPQPTPAPSFPPLDLSNL